MQSATKLRHQKIFIQCKLHLVQLQFKQNKSIQKKKKAKLLIIHSYTTVSTSTRKIFFNFVFFLFFVHLFNKKFLSFNMISVLSVKWTVSFRFIKSHCRLIFSFCFFFFFRTNHLHNQNMLV